ncbi:unnamed protein product [Caenorhabditis bovis]|uniref:Uncharacterized protein n=1 Tax=Caenorhabditis bovis TaxID=2654633 RepID=A0A8S1EK82_9PELO|nr:unnamed protein product [Caenorhabditis bovis]
MPPVKKRVSGVGAAVKPPTKRGRKPKVVNPLPEQDPEPDQNDGGDCIEPTEEQKMPAPVKRGCPPAKKNAADDLKDPTVDDKMEENGERINEEKVVTPAKKKAPKGKKAVPLKSNAKKGELKGPKKVSSAKKAPLKKSKRLLAAANENNDAAEDQIVSDAEVKNDDGHDQQLVSTENHPEEQIISPEEEQVSQPTQDQIHSPEKPAESGDTEAPPPKKRGRKRKDDGAPAVPPAIRNKKSTKRK